MLCGNHDSDDIIEIIIRGMRDEQAVKHRLLEKLDEGKIKNFEQLRHILGTEILKHHGTSRDRQTKPLIYHTSQNLEPERERTSRQQQLCQPKVKAFKYSSIYSVPELDWPRPHRIPHHLLKDDRLYTILKQKLKGECWACGGDHAVRNCNPDVIKHISLCNGKQKPTCLIRHAGHDCPFLQLNFPDLRE